MSTATHNFDRLDELAAAQVECEITRAEFMEFESLLDDEANRRRYLNYLVLHGEMLWEAARSEKSEATLPERKPDAPLSTPRSKSWLNRASRHPKVPAIAVALAVMVSLLLAMSAMPVSNWIAGDSKSKLEERKPEAKPEFVANLTNWQDDKWLEGTRPPRKDPRLELGKRLVLESGFAEITYTTGARVVLEGPADYWIVGEKTGQLEFGKLTARVDDETAKGFAIDTPFARVEDLGTEFGIEVRRGGAADVVVLDGEVDLIQESPEGLETTRVRLVKNQGATIAAGGESIDRNESVDPGVIALFRQRIDHSFEPQGIVRDPGFDRRIVDIGDDGLTETDRRDVWGTRIALNKWVRLPTGGNPGGRALAAVPTGNKILYQVITDSRATIGRHALTYDIKHLEADKAAGDGKRPAFEVGVWGVSNKKQAAFALPANAPDGVDQSGFVSGGDAILLASSIVVDGKQEAGVDFFPSFAQQQLDVDFGEGFDLIIIGFYARHVRTPNGDELSIDNVQFAPVADAANRAIETHQAVDNTPNRRDPLGIRKDARSNSIAVAP